MDLLTKAQIVKRSVESIGGIIRTQRIVLATIVKLCAKASFGKISNDFKFHGYAALQIAGAPMRVVNSAVGVERFFFFL